MRTWLLFPALAALAVGLSARPAPAADPIDTAKEEAALQKNAEAFVEAFNKGDAKALAAFFTDDGDLADLGAGRQGQAHHVAAAVVRHQGERRFDEFQGRARRQIQERERSGGFILYRESYCTSSSINVK